MSLEFRGNRLQTRAQALLTQRECEMMKVAMGKFREDHSVLTFCRELQIILNSPEKLSLLRELYLAIPDHLKSDFQQLCSLHFGIHGARVLHDLVEETSQTLDTSNARTPTKQGEGVNISLLGKSPSRSEKKGKRTPKKDDKESKKKEKKERKRTKSSHQSLETLSSATRSSENEGADSANAMSARDINIKKVKLEHKNGVSLGFSIRGGVDLRTGIFISQVDPGSQAEKKGLKAGERILKVNDTAFKNITHAEAVVALKSSQKLTVYVAQLGQMPGVSAQVPVLSPRQHDEPGVRSPSNPEKSITVLADEDGWLGCSIRGGSDYNMEVTVASVDPLSPALRAGLKRGQRISKVNDVVVRNLTHLQIVNLVTASNVVRFVVRPPGKSKRSTSISSPRGQQTGNHNSGMPSNQGGNQLSPRRVTRRHSSPPKSQPDRQLLSRPTTPLRAGQSHQENLAALEQELQSTSPISSSTPLPPPDHPALERNRQTSGNVLTTLITQTEREPRIDQTTEHHDRTGRENTSGSSVENDTPNSMEGMMTPERATRLRDEKLRRLQQGTVGRNLDSPSKEAVIPSKFHGDNVLMRRSSSKVHVKNLFNAHAAGHLPDNSLDGINFGLFSPKEEGDKSLTVPIESKMNMLSTPHSRRRDISPVIPLYDTSIDNYSSVDGKVLNLPANDGQTRSLPKSHRETMQQLQHLRDVDVDMKLGDSADRNALSNALSTAMKNKMSLDDSPVIGPNITDEANSDWRLW